MIFKTLQSGLFLFLLFAASALFFWLINDYIMPIFWAIVLTIAFHPIHRRILRYTNGRANLSALLTITFILIVVLVPLYVLATLIAGEAINLYQAFAATQDFSSQHVLAQLQLILQPLAQFGVDINAIPQQVAALMQNLSAHIGSYALDIGRATANTIIATLLMLYILFFTFRDGEKIGARIMQVLPIGDRKEQMLFERFVSIVHAMFRGTFVVALIQGVLGGILFAVVGIESAVLWAFVMGVLALIPALGTPLVWLPAGVLLLVTGSVWQGVVVLVVGATVISVVDNALRPVLVAKGAAMPDVLVLISVLGGLTLFGAAGIIVGPVITAFFLSMWQLFEHDYERELKKYG